MIQNIAVLGGGSAGFIAAITLKKKLPELRVRVVRSPDIGVIGVGEGTTASFPRHFFEYLKLNPQDFYAGAEPTWKLGIRFLWGPRREFFYTFAKSTKNARLNSAGISVSIMTMKRNGSGRFQH
jgi:tryptophan halogenase